MYIMQSQEWRWKIVFLYSISILFRESYQQQWSHQNISRQFIVQTTEANENILISSETEKRMGEIMAKINVLQAKADSTTEMFKKSEQLERSLTNADEEVGKIGNCLMDISSLQCPSNMNGQYGINNFIASFISMHEQIWKLGNNVNNHIAALQSSAENIQANISRMDRMNQLLAPVPHPSSYSEHINGHKYFALTAAEKQAKIWSNCLKDSRPGHWFGHQTMSGFLKESMCPTFITPGDELPHTSLLALYRKKFIHTVGTVGLVEWQNLENHTYTGIFEGASYGIARLSFTEEPNSGKLITTPGMGLKFLRNGMDSANLVAMYSFNGQESWNFFKNNLSNHVDKIDSSKAAIAEKFASATKHIQQVGLSDWGRYGEDGEEIHSPMFPFRLRFEPMGDIAFSDTFKQSFIEDLKMIPKGRTLYRVFAQDKPSELRGEEQYIANLVLVSDMLTSQWGDHHLFFRHQNMEEDLALHPDWGKYVPMYEGFISDSSGCPV